MFIIFSINFNSSLCNIVYIKQAELTTLKHQR